MCGDDKNLSNVIIEGVMLTVCENCARYGRVVKIDNFKQKHRKEIKIKIAPEITFEIVNDYSSKIKNARERFGLKQDELALKISEKSSELHNLESGKLKPSFNLARKLEKFLNIKLIEEIKEEKSPKINFKDNEITIADLIKFKKSKNE